MIQCFVRRSRKPIFSSDEPRLVYVSNTEDNPVFQRVLHAHDDYAEFILIYSGAGEYLINGKRYDVAAGDLIIYNSGVVHDEPFHPNGSGARFCMAVSGLKLPNLRENAFIRDDAYPVFKTRKSFNQLYTLFSMMFTVCASGETYAEEYAHHLMCAILTQSWYVAHHGSGRMAQLPEPHVLGERTKQYIDEHYTQNISLSDIANALNVSVYYMSHIFKDMSGYSPMQYLLRRRIGEAQTLLITTDLSITRIAQIVGYDTPNHFTAQFIKNTGISPRKYRQTYIINPHATNNS